MKNHYLIVQITDILRQLLENRVEEIRGLTSGIKEISSRLLESFRREKVTIEDTAQINKHIQIRSL